MSRLTFWALVLPIAAGGLGAILLLSYLISSGALGDEQKSDGSAGATLGGAPSTAPPSPSSRDCRDVSRSVARDIAEGDQIPPGMTLYRGAAYDAPVPVRRTFFIAIEFSSGTADRQVGVWAIEGTMRTGAVYSVDDVASDQTNWPNGVDIGVLNVENGEVDGAIDCLDELY